MTARIDHKTQQQTHLRFHVSPGKRRAKALQPSSVIFERVTPATDTTLCYERATLGRLVQVGKGLVESRSLLRKAVNFGRPSDRHEAKEGVHGEDKLRSRSQGPQNLKKASETREEGLR